MEAMLNKTFLIKPKFSLSLLLLLIFVSSLVQFDNILNYSLHAEIISEDMLDKVNSSKNLLLLLSFIFQAFISFFTLILETIIIYLAAYMGYKNRWELKHFFFTIIEATIVTLTLNIVISFTLFSVLGQVELQQMIGLYIFINLLKPVLIYFLLIYKKLFSHKLKGLVIIYSFYIIALFVPGFILFISL